MKPRQPTPEDREASRRQGGITEGGEKQSEDQRSREMRTGHEPGPHARTRHLRGHATTRSA
jgi:hypothetical protein